MQEYRMNPISTERHGPVAVIVTDNPPVNALGITVRQGLVNAIRKAVDDNSVEAIVIRCDGRTFFAGADITEFGKPLVEPLLDKVIDMLELCPKPVIAAIHGTALGGGLEVALGCHYRIAAASAKLGVPEVKLGLLPGGGGTQRLPRLVGIEAAAKMCALGNPVSTENAMQMGLIDSVSHSGDLAEDAIAFALKQISLGPRPTRDLRISGDLSALDAMRSANARRWKGFEAPYANLACVEAATKLPFDEGMKFERVEFIKLLTGKQSEAQRHIFFAERQAPKIEGLGGSAEPRDIATIGIIGAGTMGGGIAMNFLQMGMPVTIVEQDEAALSRGVANIRSTFEAAAGKGRHTQEQAADMMALLTPSLSLDALAENDLIIEAVYEDMNVKKEVFSRLDAIAKPSAILATNTSFLDVDEIAQATLRPQSVLGMHFFSPANVMKLLEVVRGEKTAPDVLATAMAIARKIGKIAVVAGVCPGFIGNRMLYPRQLAAMQLVLEGATPEQIDRVHTEFGMPMGPFQMSDLAGLDIGWHGDPGRVETMLEAMCAAGRFGQKNGMGFYDYDGQRRPSNSIAAANVIAKFRSESGAITRSISDSEILERTIYPMVNEGFKILAEGKAQRASDIDIVWVYGYGWPIYRGGPMFWGELIGRKTIADALHKYGIEPAAALEQSSEAAKI